MFTLKNKPLNFSENNFKEKILEINFLNLKAI